MRRFNKIKMCIGVATLGAMVISSSVCAQTIDKTDAIVAAVDEADIPENNYDENTIKAYETSFVTSPDGYESQTFRDYVQTYIALEFNVFDLKKLAENGFGQFTFGGKTFTDGVYVVEWEDSFESMVIETTDDEFNEMVSNLDPDIWIAKNEYLYETPHEEGEGFASACYNPVLGILTVSFHNHYNPVSEKFAYSLAL